jgi:hypothetical protein
MKRRAIQTTSIAALALAGAAVLFAANFFVPNNQPFGYIASPTTSSSNFSSGNETIYAPWFENSTFTGDLLAIPVAANGAPDALNPDWRGQLTIAAQDPDTGRFIVTTTRDAGNVQSAIPFRWPSLSAGQRTLMDPLNAAAASSPVLDYVRGDQSNEQQNGGAYRNRASLLGAIIHSTPRYVGAPNAGFTYSGYPAFTVANANRPPRVFAGANDGMLHAFDAVTGDEVFAFVPGAVVKNLPLIKRRPYLNQYYVDGPMTTGDALFPSDAAWHSVLVGGLGAGGQGYFALDITSAADITLEDNSVDGAGSRVLWEFTDADDPNMGYSYGRSSVVRLEDGSFVAIVANGYVNNASDGAQGDGHARLYALNIETGAVVGEMEVAVASDSALSPNGLSSPTVIDANSNFKADAVYAGDLKGNVWRFDISGAPGGWDGATNATLLFTATDTNDVAQAITTPPDVTFHPYGGFLVLVGTGRLFDSDDIAPDPDTQLNAVYGLWDKVPGTTTGIDKSTLIAQSMTEVSHANGTRVRVSTNNPVDGSANPIAVDWTSYNGWKVDLPAGERVLTDGRLRDGRFQFTSMNPTIATGENWLVQLDYLAGRAPADIVLDIDRDSYLTVADNVDGNGDGDFLDPEDHAIAQYQSFGLASQPLFASISSTQDSAIINHLNAIDPIEFDELEELYGDDPGLAGGHFDLDTATQIYALGSGITNKHTHEWDDKTGLTGVDYFNLVGCSVAAPKGEPSPCLEDPSLVATDPSYDHLDSTIPSNTQQFILVVANDRLSTGGVMELNSTSLSVVTYGNLISDAVAGTGTLPVYQLGASPPAGVQQLTSLKMNFNRLAILQGGLVGTNTGCVRDNLPGPNGEYRNGALTMQAIAWDGTQSVAQLIHDDNHYAERDLLWEATIFWHWDPMLCYGQSDWQAQWDACIVEGRIWECADVPVPDGWTPPPPPPACYLGPPLTLTKANGCTADTFFPTTLEWFTSFDKALCPVPAVSIDHDFEFDFKEAMTDEEFTLTFNYDSGSSESVTFGPTDIFATPQGMPLEVDLTALKYAEGKGNDKLKGITLRNRSASAISLDSIDISWTGGSGGGQHLEKSKAKANLEYAADVDETGQHLTPWTWAINRTLRATEGAGDCEYTLELEYGRVDKDTGLVTTGYTVSHDFDDRLTGISGGDVQIDFDEAGLENVNTDVSCIRLRSRLEDIVVITDARIRSQDATASQWLAEVDDRTAPATVLDLFTGTSILDAETDVDGASGGVSFSPLSGLGGITLGGIVAGTASCPAGINWDDAPGGGGGGDGSDPPPDGDPPIVVDPPISGDPYVDPVPLTPVETGFNITNTTGSADNQTGRLMWREIVR